MTAISVFLAFLFLVRGNSLALGTENKSASRCPISNLEKGWTVFVDPVHRFCFQYPSTYEQLRPPFEPDRFHPDAKVIAQFESAELRRATEEDRARAAIFLSFSKVSFNLQNFISDAPTGVERPPSPVRFGALTFFYYGPGGGGVAYDDIYYFNLHNRTLRIVFDGPFDGHSKSPSEKTQQIESAILASFKIF